MSARAQKSFVRANAYLIDLEPKWRPVICIPLFETILPGTFDAIVRSAHLTVWVRSFKELHARTSKPSPLHNDQAS